jgi:splicing factor 1
MNLSTDITRFLSADFHNVRLICRSPSPEPIYNSEGKRLNTREFRIRKKLEDERQALIQEAMRLNPNFKPAGGE